MMKFGLNYKHFLAFLIFLCYVNCDSEANYKRMAKMRRKVYQAYGNISVCLHGGVIISNNMTNVVDQSTFDIKPCTIKEPLCAVVRQKLISSSSKNKKYSLILGCFPSPLASFCTDYDDDLRTVICADDYVGQLMGVRMEEMKIYFLRIMGSLEFHILMNKKRANHPELDLTTKKPEILVDEEAEKEEIGIPLEVFGFGIRVSHGVMTPQLAFYIIFICIAVFVKLVWLVSTTLKVYRYGYAEVKTTAIDEDEDSSHGATPRVNE